MPGPHDLQRLLCRLYLTSEKYNIQISTVKTQSLGIYPLNPLNANYWYNINIINRKVEQTLKFKYPTVNITMKRNLIKDAKIQATQFPKYFTKKNGKRNLNSWKLRPESTRHASANNDIGDPNPTTRHIRHKNS